MNSLKQARMDAYLSQCELARKSRVPRHVIALFEVHGVTPTPPYQRKIAKYLKRETEALFNQ